MAQTQIGALRITLGMDSAAFEKGARQAQASMQRMSKQMQAASAAVAAAATAAVAALGMAVKGTLQHADQMGKMAQSTGIAVEELSKLKYVAEMSGSSLEGLSTGLRRLSTSILQVSQGAGGEAAKAFQALGINVKAADGSLKDSSAVLSEVAGKFAAMPDGVQKTALAVQLFGRSGAELIPMLNAGADGIDRMKNRAEELGLVIDQKTARAAERFNDNIADMQAIGGGLVTLITGELAPAFDKVSGDMVGAAKMGNVFRQVAEWIGKEVRHLIAGFYELVGAVRAAGIAMQSFKAWGVNIASLDLGAAGQSLREGMGEAFEAFYRHKKQADELRKGIVAIGTDGTAALKPLKIELDKLAGSGGGGGKRNGGAAGTADAVRSIGTSARAATPELQGLARATESMREMGSQIESTLGSAFEGLVTRSEGLREALQGILSDLSRMAAQSAFKSLFGAVTGALGGGAVGAPMAINKYAGAFANGGSFKVGGAGGIDSQLVAFHASPSEMVDIRKPGQDAGRNAFAPVYHIDARGADVGAVQRIEAALAQRDRDFDRRVTKTMIELRRRSASGF
jgi:hypothetical protein